MDAKLPVVLSLQEAELFFDAIARLGDGELERLARLMRSLQHRREQTQMVERTNNKQK